MDNPREQFEKPEGLLRDPKTGRYLNALKSAAGKAKFAAAAHGKEESQKDIIAQVVATEGESRLVQNYLIDFQKLVRDFEGPTAAMRKIIPLIKEVEAFADKDMNLSETERKHLHARAADLVAYIERRTTLITKSQSKLRKLAKEAISRGGSAVGGAVEGFGDTLSRSSSLIGKVAGRLTGAGFNLARSRAERRKEAQDQAKEAADAEKQATAEALETRSNVYGRLLQYGGAASTAKSRRGGVESFNPFEDIVIGSGKAPKAPKPLKGKSAAMEASEAAPKRTTKKVGKSVESEGTLDAILTTDQAILKQLEIQTQILRTNNEFADQLHEEAERARDVAANATAAKQATGISKVEKVPKDVEAGGKSFLEKLTQIVGSLDIAKLGIGIIGDAAKLLGPALGLMAKGAAVVGAAWVGWEVGSWIAKMVGLGDSSDALRKLLDTKSQSIASSLESAGHAGVEEGKHLLNKVGIGQGSEEDKAKADNAKIRAQQLSRGKYHAKAQDWTLDEANKFLQNLPANAVAAPEKPVGQAVTSAPALDNTRLPEYAPTLPGLSSPAPSSFDEKSVGDAVTKPAPSSFDYENYRETIAKRESGGNYGVVNKLGFVGRYQMGVAALGDFGLMKKGLKQSKAVVDDPSNWLLQGGKEAFLNDHALQDRIMKRYTDRNRKALERLKVLSKSSDASTIAGSLAQAHLLGPGSLVGKGGRSADAFGTSGASYYRMAAIAQASPMPGRAAAPVIMATNATGTEHGGQQVVVAPTMIAGNSGQQSPAVIIPQPMTTENPNQLMKAIRGANSV